MDEILTLFYMKSSGVIKCYCSGKQTLDYYGAEKVDVEPLIDYIYVKFDQFLLNNLSQYKVVNGKVELIQPATIEVVAL